jgi:hypothetical protein
MFDVLVVDNEKGIGCLGNLECLMRRPADDVKLQERWKPGRWGLRLTKCVKEPTRY